MIQIHKFLTSLLLTMTMIYPVNYAVAGEVINDAVTKQKIYTKYIAGIKLKHNKEIYDFYSARNNKPLWIDGNDFNYNAKNVLKELEKSWEHGLNPSSYHVGELKNTLRGFDAELILTNAVINYASDLTGMRISPKEIDEDTSSWSRGIDPNILLQNIANDSDPATFLRYLAPQDKTYMALKNKLRELVDDIAKNPDEKYKPVKYSGLIRPHQRSAAIIAIRERLEMPESYNTDPSFYDDKLKSAVIEFQRKNGLKTDGIIGRRSFNAINQTREQILIKVLANLERRRWVRRDIPSRYVAVNIPAMLLRAIDNSNVQFEIPVIVGRVERPTMSFVDAIEGVRFNPSWYVPDTIKNKDYLPELQKDPEALAKKQMKFRVKTEDGELKEIASNEIDWVHMTPENLQNVQMFQDPSDANVLGKVRVLMPNKYDIYLHDTSNPELFAKDDRALSSGCVRLSEPIKIANFVLEKNPNWSHDRLEYYLKKRKTIEIKAVNPIPVYLFYYTIWQDFNNELIIGDDIYGLDTKLISYLQESGKIPFQIDKKYVNFKKY